MKIQVFNGGKNTRQAPHLLQTNEAVTYSNIDNEASTLKPVKKKALTGETLDQWAYYFIANSSWMSSATKRHYLEYQAQVYYTEANQIPKYFDGTNTYLLGIAGPISAPLVAVNATGALTGTYTYVFTYYNSVKGIESKPSPISNEVAPLAQGVDLTGMAASIDPQVDKKRIYRVGGTITQFSLVDTIDNVTTAYYDIIADTDIDGRALLAENYGQAPQGLKYLTEAYGILFGALDDKLYFSLTGQFTYWPEVNFIDFPVEITGIAAITLGLLVFTRERTYIITGTSTASFSKRQFSGDQGCTSFDSIRYTKNNILWTSLDGFCTVDGATVKVISRDKLGAVTLDVINSAFHNEVYYVLKSDNTILALDFRYQPALKDLSLDVTNLVVAQDILYGYKTDTYYELFADTADETFTYLSPELSDGSLTLRKTYKSVLIHSSGSILVDMYIDGIKRISARALTTHESHEIKVPEEYKNGYHVQFGISGTGEVIELDYTVGAFEK